MTRSRRSPVYSYLDPRVEVYAPTDSFPYYRIAGYDRHDNRVVETSGGSTLRKAKRKAAEVSRQIDREEEHLGRDPTTTPVAEEVELWLDPANHRARGNKPWSNRHAENMRREWRLRIEPHLSANATVIDLVQKHLWIRILNQAQASGLAPASVQKTGQACRSFVTWLMDRGLLERNPMHGVSYSMTKADNAGLDPKAVQAGAIPNLDQVHDLCVSMAYLSSRERPGNIGTRIPDACSPQGRGLQPMFVAMTGLRNAEMFALRANHVDLDTLDVRIEVQWVEEDSGEKYEAPPKHGSIRTVTVAEFLVEDLADLIEHRRKVSGEVNPLLFCGPGGQPDSRRNHNRRFRRAARRAGWEDHLKWYGLRHLYAVTMLERLPLEIVSRLMGHHSPDFTAKRYLSLRTGWLDEARSVARTFDPTTD